MGKLTNLIKTELPKTKKQIEQKIESEKSIDEDIRAFFNVQFGKDGETSESFVARMDAAQIIIKKFFELANIPVDGGGVIQDDIFNDNACDEVGEYLRTKYIEAKRIIKLKESNKNQEQSSTIA